MSIPVHIAMGILIGKVTGNYTLSLLAATVVDLDHGISYARNGILFSPRKLMDAIVNEHDPWGNQRNILHNVFIWGILSAVSFAGGFQMGLAITLGYLSHLILDAMDTADYYPFFPSKKVNLKGSIIYFSRHETVFVAIIAAVYFLL
jgi:membrane-bound metal-dependent hydrolase YbcI (DUF457 family)